MNPEYFKFECFLLLKTHHSHLKAFFKVHSRGAGETDELVKCLSRKHGDLSWIPKPTFFLKVKCDSIWL